MKINDKYGIIFVHDYFSHIDMLKSTFKVSFLLIFVALTASACTFPWEKNRADSDTPLTTYAINNQKNTGPSGDLKKIQENAELKDFLFGHVAASSVIESVPGADKNTVVKAEGNYIYALVKNDIFIINSLYAPEAQVVGKISLSSRPLGILVSGQRVAVYGVDEQIKSSAAWNSFKREGDYVFFKIYDVADPANPKQVKDLAVEGKYAGLKLVGSHAYLMTTANISYIENEPLTPRVLESGQVVSGDCRDANNCVVPEVSYFDASYDDYYYLSIMAVSLADSAKAISINDYLLDSKQAAYAPSDSLYLSNTSSVSEYDLQNELKRDQVFDNLSAADQTQIEEIESLPETLLSATEKAVKVAAIINAYVASLSDAEKTNLQAMVDASLVEKIKANMNEIEKTTVYKIIFDAGKIVYQAKGNIFGQIISGSGLSENNGQLRLVTARNEMWSKLFKDTSKVYNNLYVLDDGLRLTGKLENIATSAQIRSVQFIGDRAYLKTAKVNDALYVADFSDGTKPGILGAVQIPNPAAHIYQADEKGDILLSFSRNLVLDTNGATLDRGLKLSLFDFSDLQNPKELSGYVIGDASSNSIALDDSQALYNSVVNSLVSVPVSLYNNGSLSFSGALVFSTTGGELALRGRVDHSNGGMMSVADSWGGFSYYDNTVRRSDISDSDLLTFSNKFLKINKIANLSEVGSLLLTPSAEDYIISPADGQETNNGTSTSELGTTTSDNLDFEPAHESGSESSVNNNPSSNTATSSTPSEISGTVTPESTSTSSPTSTSSTSTTVSTVETSSATTTSTTTPSASTETTEPVNNSR